MTRYRILVTSILLASSLGVVAAPLVTDPQNCGPMGPRGENWKQRSGNIEMHHQKFHAALKLMPEQEGAWKKLMDSEPAMAKSRPANSEDWSKLTTPERADKMLERMKEHQAQQTEHVAALKDFYAVLTPEQKKTFDDFHSSPRAGMRAMPQNRSSSSVNPPSKP
ncbi:MAG: Spy/CpxP family protein refolding chaperone [Propionivibrio sp.]|uniref:Spy/CpxP family protein refolding chaperone n=1 Tax=Candidatus Propionivibrio dominans TaxID=2954373 RepID=A0A9D7IC14_9RHOO|nr:Spy/CpxP family protein refolding chaperone [Candidatus Propionivibrio dominans]